MRIVLITQARVGSTRLPNKVFSKIGEETMLSLHIKRLLKSKRLDKIVVATTYESGVNKIIKICNELKVEYYQGSLDDVLDRFYQAAKKFKSELIVRVTSDCPLIDPLLIDEIIDIAVREKVDYCSNTITEDFPDGQDIEVFTFKSLEKAWMQSKLKSEREHVTPFIRNNSTAKGVNLFTSYDVINPINNNEIRMTVDEFADLKTIELLVSELGINSGWQDYTKFLLENRERLSNTQLIRNEGYLKSISKD